MSKNSKELIILMNGRQVGKVYELENARLEFVYDKAWHQSSRNMPLSLSMPLTKSTHEHRVVSAFMWGLLPDNEFVLSDWGKRHNVSPKNCFSLLGAVGEDCPGAIQFYKPEDLQNLNNQQDLQWLNESEFEELIIRLRQNPGAGRPSNLLTGQFSLAGAQPKTALYKEGNKWAIPQGRIPTTHILKPTIGDIEGHAQNEHFCLQLAGHVGLPSAETRVLNIADTQVICVTRYDRQKNKHGQLVRIHQEDMCQSLGVHPAKKYENEGGPGISTIMTALQKFSSNAAVDRDRFMRAQAFNFILAGTDAHAKNYSFVIAPNNKVRLAPLYDIASYLPYTNSLKKQKMAMKIASQYKISEISSRHWSSLSKETEYSEEHMLRHIRDLLITIPGHSLSVYQQCSSIGLDITVLDKLLDLIWERCKQLIKHYGTEEKGAD